MGVVTLAAKVLHTSDTSNSTLVTLAARVTSVELPGYGTLVTLASRAVTLAARVTHVCRLSY